MRKMVMALVFGLLATACGSSTTTTTAGSAPVDTATPPVVAAASARAAIASGQPTVLLFTQVGCASCVAVAKAMAAAAAGRPDVHLVGVDMTGSDDAATLRSFLADVGLASLPFTWTIDTDGALTQQYGVLALSTTIGVSKGKVRFTNTGAASEATLRAQVAEL